MGRRWINGNLNSTLLIIAVSNEFHHILRSFGSTLLSSPAVFLYSLHSYPFFTPSPHFSPLILETNKVLMELSLVLTKLAMKSFFLKCYY
jgi:hypothetical protein